MMRGELVIGFVKCAAVRSQAALGDNSTRIEIKTPEYTQVVLYQHVTRRKN